MSHSNHNSDPNLKFDLQEKEELEREIDLLEGRIKKSKDDVAY